MKGKEHSLMEEAGAETWKLYRAAEPAQRGHIFRSRITSLRQSVSVYIMCPYLSKGFWIQERRSGFYFGLLKLPRSQSLQIETTIRWTNRRKTHIPWHVTIILPSTKNKTGDLKSLQCKERNHGALKDTEVTSQIMT